MNGSEAKWAIQCVVVIYRKTLLASETLRSMEDVFRGSAELARHFSVLLYDNSPQSQVFERLSVEHTYIHDPSNGGLLAAYSSGLRVAEQSGREWLLVLDQDTLVHAGYFRALVEAVHANPLGKIGAIVPKLVRNGEVLSPKRQPFSLFEPSKNGRRNESLMVFNSGACFRVEAIEAIGGFPREFWLDFLDHMVFHRLQKSGWRIEVLQAELEHQLSLKNISVDMSFERYVNFLNAEMMMLSETVSRRRVISHRVVLLLKSLWFAFRLRDKRFAEATWRCAVSGRATVS